MTRRTSFAVAALVATLLLLPAAAAHAHGVAPQPNMTEKQLRAFETGLLGARHAREHANLRRLERKQAAAARRHARWLRSLSAPARRAVLRKERLRKRRATAKQRAYLSKQAEALAPDQYGQWTTAPFKLRTSDGHHVIGINAAMLPTGKVLLYSYPTNPNPTYGAGTSSPNEATAFVWDPGKGTGPSSFKEFIPPEDPEDPGHPANIWCSGISFLADGTILVTGGNYRYDPDWRGLDTVYTFNPFTETWHYEGKMADGRWYPTQVLLPDGRTVIMSGYSKTNTADGKAAYNRDIEVYDPAKPAGQRIYKIVTRTADFNGNQGAKQPPGGGLYPHNFLMPSGNVLVAGPFYQDSWYFKASDVPTANNGLPFSQLEQLGAGLPGGGEQDQVWATGVIVPSTDPAKPSTKIMLLGGSFPPTPDTGHATRGTEILDDANQGAGWQAGSLLNVGRSHANTVLLPDGSMVTVGGGYGIDNNNQWLTNQTTHRQVELWNPTTKAWTLGPSQVEDRAYHSTAVLLPDGRVLSAGDDWNGSDDSGNPVQGGTYGISGDSAEIYSPPYLFKGVRPTITHAPTGTPYGGLLSVDTPDTNVTRAALVAPSATTHANDMNQRYVALSVTPREEGVNLAVPSSANVVPPGYYMLFLINSSGVPSVATWVRVGAGLPQPPIKGARPTLTGNPAPGGTVIESYPGTWSGTAVSLTRQWRRCNTFGESCTDIAGAAGTSYVVTASDVGSTLRLRVTGSNASGSIPADSTPTGVVPATPVCTTCGAGGAGCEGCGSPGAKDTKAPTLSFKLPSRRTLKALLKSGLTLRVKCSEACTLSAVLDLSVTVSTKSGKRKTKKVRVYVLGRKSASASSAAKTVTVRIKLTRSGRSRLRHVKPRRVRLTLTAKDAAGNRTKKSRTIRILRR